MRLLLAVALLFVVAGAAAEEQAVAVDAGEIKDAAEAAALRAELAQLREKISALGQFIASVSNQTRVLFPCCVFFYGGRGEDWVAADANCVPALEPG